MEYVRSVNESSTPRYPQPLWDPESVQVEGQHRQSLGPPSLLGPTVNLYHDFRPSRTSLDQGIPESNDDTSRSYRRQSLQLGSDRRASLAAEVEKRMRRSSPPNTTLKDLKPQQRRVVGNGIYKLETLPWHKSSLRQAVARRAHERKE